MNPIFDPLKINFADPAVQELVDMLVSHFELLDEIRQITRDADVSTARFSLQRGAALVWPDVLQAARAQERVRELLDAIKRANGAVGKRVDELVNRPRPLLAVVPKPRSGAVWKPWKGGSEVQTGARSSLLDVDFLAKGVRAAAAVCKIVVRAEGGLESWGSGFLVAPDLVLSNYHVLFQGDGEGPAADAVEVLFRYETGAPPQAPIEGIAASIRGDRDLDWAVVRLAAPAPDGCAPLTLGASRKMYVGDPAFIVQHPGGGPKQIGLYRNEIRYVDDHVVHYLTDTRQGSSGSPVCNDRWEVIALHHRWIEADAAPTRELRNEGVRIERVLDGLRAGDLVP